jgi:hypothetical protein
MMQALSPTLLSLSPYFDNFLIDATFQRKTNLKYNNPDPTHSYN